MIARAAVIAEARDWLGTPFSHQQHTKGLATDCLGFIGGVAVAVGVFPASAWTEAFAEHASYGRLPYAGRLVAACREFLIPIDIDAAREADILCMRFTGEPAHVAYLAPYVHGGLSLVHAWSRARPQAGVVEHVFDRKWRSRVVEAFALPGVA